MGFTGTELDYLAGQPLGRVATAQPNPQRLISFGIDDPDRDVRSLAINRRNFDD